MLEAIDQEIAVTEIDPDMLEKFCGALDFAYTVVDEGELVIPKIETLQHVIFNSDHF